MSFLDRRGRCTDTPTTSVEDRHGKHPTFLVMLDHVGLVADMVGFSLHSLSDVKIPISSGGINTHKILAPKLGTNEKKNMETLYVHAIGLSGTNTRQFLARKFAVNQKTFGNPITRKFLALT